MIRCKSCGHPNDVATAFCASCGMFLEWMGDVDGVALAETMEIVGTDDIGETDEVPEIDEPDEEAEPDEATVGLGGDDVTQPSAPPVGRPDVVPPPPERSPPPPAPPLAGTRVDRPPPLTDPSRPDGWAAPTPRATAATRTSPDVLRVLARPLDANGHVPRGGGRPPRRSRGVHVQPPPDEGSETARDDGEQTFGPLLPGMQRDFAPVASVRQAPTRVPQPGDLLCPRCSEANLPSRSFCRRCGELLVPDEDTADAQGAMRRRWWHRFMRRRRDRRTERRYRAGERPAAERPAAKESRLRRLWRSIRKVGRVGVNYLLAILAILALLATVLPQAAPLRTDVVHWLESTGGRIQHFLVPQYVRVNPIAITASSALPDHPAELAIDGFSNTYWSAEGSGIGQTMTITFQEPTQLSVLAVINGGVPANAEFIAQPRPRLVQLLFDDGTTADVELRDEPDFQEHRIDAPPTVRMSVRILSIYEATAPGGNVSLSEIEFLRRL